MGNTFIIIESDELGRLPTKEEVETILDRVRGASADGLLLLHPSEVASKRMQYFNPDGSEAEICGNALRSIGFHLFLEDGKRSHSIETRAGVKSVEVTSVRGSKGGVRLNLGPLEGEYIPYRFPQLKEIDPQKYMAFFTRMPGNPHVVIFGPIPEDKIFLKWGPMIERDPLFPERTNVNFVEKIQEHAFYLRAWERGTGETLSCATGAASAFLIGLREGWIKGHAKFLSKGGELTLKVEDEDLLVEGWVQRVLSGKIYLDLSPIQRDTLEYG